MTQKALTDTISVELLKKRSFTIASNGEIASAGIIEINDILRDELSKVIRATNDKVAADQPDNFANYLAKPDWQKDSTARISASAYITELWEHTPRVWLVQKSDSANGSHYAGTLPKRISKHFHDVCKINLDKQIIARIGEIASRHTAKADDYIIDFHNKIDWQPGNFGESAGSCWWGGYSASRGILIDDLDGMAVRFYRSNGNGYARAWIVPQCPAPDTFVIFNGYGHDTVKIARILSTHLGLSYKQINLSNWGECDNDIYINGSTGYVIGTQDAIENIHSHDFEVEGTGDYQTCYNCGDRIYDDSSYYAYDHDYCEACYDDLFSICEHCSEPTRRDHTVIVHAKHTYNRSIGAHTYEETWCEDCARYSNEYAQCHECGEDYYHIDTMRGVSFGEYYCDDCAEHIHHCDVCDTDDYVSPRGHNAERWLDINNQHVCPDCVYSEFILCPDCDTYAQVEHTKTANHAHCENCDVRLSRCTDCKTAVIVGNDTVCPSCQYKQNEAALERRLELALADDGNCPDTLEDKLPQDFYARLFYDPNCLYSEDQNRAITHFMLGDADWNIRIETNRHAIVTWSKDDDVYIKSTLTRWNSRICNTTIDIVSPDRQRIRIGTIPARSPFIVIMPETLAERAIA